MLNWTYLLRCSSVQFQGNVVRCAVEKAAVADSGGKPKEASFSKRQPECQPFWAWGGVHIPVSVPCMLSTEALLSFVL